MDRDELRIYYKRMIALERQQDCLEMLQVYIDYLFKVIVDHKDNEDTTAYDVEAKIINQMIFSKTAHFKKLSEGIKHNDGKQLLEMIDPTILANSVRHLYEMVMAFNLLYIQPSNDDESKIVQNLWVMAGLTFRQRFETNAIREESKRTIEEEKITIEELKENILSTDLYQNLKEDEQKKIKNLIKQKDYKMVIQNDSVRTLSWQSIAKVAKIDIATFENMYTYFSLHAHPSNVSVFQFQSFFQNRNNEIIGRTNIKHFIHILSVFVADYIEHFPSVLKSFEKLPLKHQIAINGHHYWMRREYDHINDALFKMG